MKILILFLSVIVGCSSLPDVLSEEGGTLPVLKKVPVVHGSGEWCRECHSSDPPPIKEIAAPEVYSEGGCKLPEIKRVAIIHGSGNWCEECHSQRLSNVKSIAVMPFNNLSNKKDADRIVRNIFIAELFKNRSFRVEEFGNIRRFLIQQRVKSINDIDTRKIKILGQRLGVDAIIAGTVEEYSDGMKGDMSSVPVIAISARMIDTDSGKILWMSHQRRTGNDYITIFDFGKIRSIISLTQRVVDEMLETMRGGGR
ncbi:MAG: GNA1162 family protein [Nitrospinota bacterium]